MVRGGVGFGGECGSDGSAETVAHGSEAPVVEDALAEFDAEGLVHDGVRAAAGAGYDDVGRGTEVGELEAEVVGRNEASAGAISAVVGDDDLADRAAEVDPLSSSRRGLIERRCS